MSTCQEWDESLTLFAAAALEPEETARVRAHLDTCAACRHQVAASQDVLGLAALPPPSLREQAVREALPWTTVGRWRRAQVRRAESPRASGGLLAAAAVLLLLLGPVASNRAPSSASAPSPDEEDLAMEQWALADPLSDALDTADPDDSWEQNDSWDLDADDVLSSPSLGDSL